MILKTTLFGHTYEFKSVREVMAKANEEKSGDKLAGIAAETAEERVAAKVVLSNLTLPSTTNCIEQQPAILQASGRSPRRMDSQLSRWRMLMYSPCRRSSNHRSNSRTRKSP